MTVRRMQRQAAAGWRAAGCAIGLLLLAGCTSAGEPDREPADAGPGTVPAEAPPLVQDTVTPEVSTETILIEGMEETIEVRAFRTPVAFPLGFSTVVPAGMAIDFVSSGEGDVVRFEAAFGGVHRPEAALIFTVLPRRIDGERAREMLAQEARQLGGVPVEPVEKPWALRQYRFQGNDVSGFIGLGEHDETRYFIAARYPPEYGDGLGPRVDLILRRWRWTDDGSPLIGS